MAEIRAKQREASLDKDLKKYDGQNLPIAPHVSSSAFKPPSTNPIIGDSVDITLPRIDAQAKQKTPENDIGKSQDMRSEEADEVWSLAYDMMSEFNDDGMGRLFSGSSTVSNSSRISPQKLRNRLRQLVDTQIKEESENPYVEKRGVNDRLFRHLLERLEDEGDTLSQLQNDQRTHYSIAKMKNYLREKAREMRSKQKAAEESQK